MRDFNPLSDLWNGVASFNWPVYVSYAKILSTFLSILFFSWWMYSFWRARKVVPKSHESVPPYQPEGELSYELDWDEVRKKASSHDADDWRVAIIEADMLLGHALEEIGFHGTSIDEQLKAMPHKEVESLPLLLQAHALAEKLRNDYTAPLTSEQVKEVMGFFEAGLRELEGMI